MKRSLLLTLVPLTLLFASGCGSAMGGGGDVPAAGMERCENCGKDVAQGELTLKKDSKVCSDCVDKI